MVLGIVWGLTAVTFIFVVLRLYTRIKVLHAYGPDDRLFNAAFVRISHLRWPVLGTEQQTCSGRCAADRSSDRSFS